MQEKLNIIYLQSIVSRSERERESKNVKPDGCSRKKHYKNSKV